jgi:hypothetical protein
MRAASAEDGAPSIGDKSSLSPGPPTSKDGALASDVIALRKALLRAPEVQGRLDQLAVLRPVGIPSERTEALAALRYWQEIELLAGDLDGCWSGGDLDALTERWLTRRAELIEGSGVGVGFAAGRGGRGRQKSPGTVELAARSLALRAHRPPDGGRQLSASEADERVADEINSGKPLDLPWTPRSTVAGCRKDLRDRLT